MSVRLLLADDHGVVREGVCAILSDYSEFLVVAEARDGIEAVELTRQVRPDVIILDLMLPGMDGLQVVRKLRQVQPSIKVVVRSARTESEVVDQVMAAGADGYVSKMLYGGFGQCAARRDEGQALCFIGIRQTATCY